MALKTTSFSLFIVILHLWSCDKPITSSDKKTIHHTLSQLANSKNIPLDSLKLQVEHLDRMNLSDPGLIATRNLIKGTYHVKNYSMDSAVRYYDLVLASDSAMPEDSLRAIAYTALGNIYKDIGKFPKAFENYQAALKIREKQNNPIATGHIYKNIGALYMSWERFDESLKYYFNAEKIALQHKDSVLYADCHNNIGAVLEQQNDYDDAIVHYKKALDIYSNHHITEGISFTYSNLAIVYKLKKEYAEAIEYNLKSLELSKHINDKWIQAATLNNIGFLYFEMGDYTLSKKYCYQSLALSREIKALEITYNTYETLAQTAFTEGELTQAFAFQQQFAATKDSFENIESNRQLSELNVKYETEKKEKTLVQQKVDIERKNIYLTLLGSAVLFCLLFLQIFKQRSKHKQVQLKLENQLLNEQTNFRIQQQRLEISRDLHDSIGAQLTLISSMLDGLKNLSSKLDETISKKINTLSDFSQNSIIELKNTLWVLNAKKINLDDLKAKILNFIRDASEAREDMKFNFDFDVLENFNLNFKQAVNLFRMVQEIVNNAIKHAEASEIKIGIIQQSENLNIKIADNGKGFDYVKEKNKSFGLTNIQNRVMAINGKINIETAVGKGTKYDIQLRFCAE